MTVNFYDNVGMTVTGTPGTGDPTLNTAIDNSYMTAAEAGVPDGTKVRYRIDDGLDFEIGTGTHNTSGPSLTRTTVLHSKISGVHGTTKLTLTSSCQVRYIASAKDFGFDGSCDQASSVASATTTDIWNIYGNSVHVTGTTTITGFGTAAKAGLLREVIFDGALTLTHGASSIVLPGAANITTAAGDRARVYADTTTKAIVVSYTRANGKSVIGPASADITDSTSTGRSLLTAASASAALALLIPSGTLMLFQQSSAPTGWTKQTTHNDKALRVVSGTASSGGSTAFSSIFTSITSGSHTLSSAEMPTHSHSSGFSNQDNPSPSEAYEATSSLAKQTNTGNAGSSGGHTHTVALAVQYVDFIIASKD